MLNRFSWKCLNVIIPMLTFYCIGSIVIALDESINGPIEREYSSG